MGPIRAGCWARRGRLTCALARIRPVAFRLAASRAYLEQHGVLRVPEDLGRHDFVTTGGFDALSLEGPQGTVEVPLRVALRSALWRMSRSPLPAAWV